MTVSPIRIVVPLAGPDFEADGGRVKSEILLDGVPLLRAALESRPWWRSGDASDADLVFVLRDTSLSRRFAKEALSVWYPRAAKIFIEGQTRGAALSALAGVTVIDDPQAVLCVDLVDIIYKSDFQPKKTFASDPLLGGVCLTFPSTNPLYSYLREHNGEVVEAAEKRVISNKASTGTYFFRNAAAYLKALAHSLTNPERVTYNGRFFVCPLMNGVIADGGRVVCSEASAVRDIKAGALC